MHLWYCQTADIRPRSGLPSESMSCPQMQLGLSPKAQPCPESQLWSRSRYHLLLSQPSCWISTERKVIYCLSAPMSEAYPGHLVVSFQEGSASTSYMWHCLSTALLCCCCFLCVCVCVQLKLTGIKVMVAQKKKESLLHNKFPGFAWVAFAHQIPRVCMSLARLTWGEKCLDIFLWGVVLFCLLSFDHKRHKATASQPLQNTYKEV